MQYEVKYRMLTAGRRECCGMYVVPTTVGIGNVPTGSESLVTHTSEYLWKRRMLAFPEELALLADTVER